MEQKILEILERNFTDSIEFDRDKATEELIKLFSLHSVNQREMVNKEVSKSIKSFCEYVMHPESDLHKDANDWIKEHHVNVSKSVCDYFGECNFKGRNNECKNKEYCGSKKTVH